MTEFVYFLIGTALGGGVVAVREQYLFRKEQRKFGENDLI